LPIGHTQNGVTVNLILSELTMSDAQIITTRTLGGVLHAKHGNKYVPLAEHYNIAHIRKNNNFLSDFVGKRVRLKEAQIFDPETGNMLWVGRCGIISQIIYGTPNKYYFKMDKGPQDMYGWADGFAQLQNPSELVTLEQLQLIE